MLNLIWKCWVTFYLTKFHLKIKLKGPEAKCREGDRSFYPPGWTGGATSAFPANVSWSSFGCRIWCCLLNWATGLLGQPSSKEQWKPNEMAAAPEGDCHWVPFICRCPEPIGTSVDLPEQPSGKKLHITSRHTLSLTCLDQPWWDTASAQILNQSPRNFQKFLYFSISGIWRWISAFFWRWFRITPHDVG